MENIKKSGYRIKETASVRNVGIASNTPEIRGEEFNQLVEDNSIDFIWCARGGDFLVQMLEYVNKSSLINHPKWVYGSSDPTTLLFWMTTSLDIATLYGHNAGSLDMKELHPSLQDALEMMKGNLVKQESFEK